MKTKSRFLGIVTVGGRGQVCIPNEARKLLGIKSGDKLVVMLGPSPHKKIINLIPASDFESFLKSFERHLLKMKEEFSKERR